jgi:hypothetical protein
MSTEKHEPKPFHIIVNARPREVSGDGINYKQVVLLAYPNADFGQFDFEVHYTGPYVPDGSLVDGQSVSLHNGLKFDVVRTNKS